MEGADPNAEGGMAGPILVGGMPLNPLVMKEPRGMIRAIQIVFAILAFATTTGFDTETKMEVTCAPQKKGESAYRSVIVYPVSYPYNFKENRIIEHYNCTRSIPQHSQSFPIDFSSSAQFYVATGVLAFLYAGAILGFYLLRTDQYASNPLLPVVDLGVTAVLTIFWFAGASAWAMNVSDIKHYTNPRYLEKHIYICQNEKTGIVDCSPLDIGNWATLNISLVFGFTNVFLWAMSMWFVFKETSFHQKNIPQPMGAPPAGFETYGQQPAQQYAPPAGGFPAQQQYSQGY